MKIITVCRSLKLQKERMEIAFAQALNKEILYDMDLISGMKENT